MQSAPRSSAALILPLLVWAAGCGGGGPTRPPARAARATTTTAASPAYVDALLERVGGTAPLTLDARLQATAEHAVRSVGKAAAVVAFEPDSGMIRALFSVPGDRGDPLVTAHVPASTFKAFAAIAGLEAGALTSATEKECTGTFDFAGTTLHCSAAHGRETTAQAIYRSCNAFFYSMATEVDHHRVLDVARRFGFGEPTGTEIPEQLGTVPDEARYAAVKQDPKSTAPLLDAIGHGEITVTLLQLARAFAVFANGGKLVRLSLTHAGGVQRTVELRPSDLELVRSALVDVVAREDGTAHAFAIPGYPFAGKTGSADAPPRNGVDTDEDAWFVAYAPPTAPKLLVAARVERADVARDAKWIVRQVLEAERARKP